MNLKTFHIDQELLIRVDQKQKQIGEYLLNCNLDYTDMVGLMDGLAGVGLLLSLFYRYTNDGRYLDGLNQTIELMNEKIYTGKTTITSYCSGIAGYAWLILYLKEKDLIEVDLDDYLYDIDLALTKSVAQMIEIKKFDQLHGAVGIGSYFLKRGNMKIVKQIIDGLFNQRKNINNNLTWSWIKDDHEILDFGLAHGIPGTLFFLFKCFLKNISPQKSAEMIRDNVSFMLNYLNLSGIPSYFPYSIDCDQIMQHDKKQNRSRLAWCYGDLTLLYVLLKLSPLFPVQIPLIPMLEHVAKRRSSTETLVKDAGLCHGSSGVAQIFYRLYRNTGNTGFEEAGKYWLAKTLLLGNEADGCAGYVFSENKNMLPLDLLVGVSGVGSVLLSFQNPELMDWDEIMFLK